MKLRNAGFVALGVYALVVTLLVVAGTVFVGTHIPQLRDAATVAQHKPTKLAVGQAKRTDMTDTGSLIFFASRPETLERQVYNETCGAEPDDPNRLACYAKSSRRIYLLHVTDPRIPGTEDVMAGHEMLRAAWDRMSAAHRKALVPALDHVLATDRDEDVDLADQVKEITKFDPTVRDAELWALIGTETKSIPPSLERSYGKYFVNRTAILALHVKSTAYLYAFNHKVIRLMATMSILDDNLTYSIDSLNAKSKKFDSDVAAFNVRAKSPTGFSSEGQFTVARNALLDRQKALKKKYTAIKKQIGTFDGDVKVLKNYAKTAESLFDSLNITIAKIPTLQAT